MAGQVPIVERSFQLAQSGDYASTAKIVLQLAKEDYPNGSHHLNGTVPCRQMRAICSGHRATPMHGDIFTPEKH